LYQEARDWWWILSFVLLTIFQISIIWIYPAFIAPLFNKFTSLENEDLKIKINELIESTNFKSQGIFVMDASRRSSHGNAYFTGFGKNKRIVFFDTLLKYLSNDEIRAILAHELGHMKLKHIIKSMVFSIIVSFAGFALIGYLANAPWFYSGHFIKITSPGVLLLLFTQVIPIYTFFFNPISSWVSRKREFEADAFAAEKTNGEDLVNGLLKLYQQNSSPVITDRLYSLFYHSHPPAEERVSALRQLRSKTS